MTTPRRLIITIVSVLAVSFIAGLLWRYMFDIRIPGYLSGLIGGFAAIPVWEYLKKRR